MSDSFFTSRNQFDEQIGHLPAIVCEHFIEASVRQMVAQRGLLHTAARLQRLSYICSGAHVLPIEHWRDLGGLANEASNESVKNSDPPWWRQPAKYFVFGMAFMALLQVVTIKVNW